jgi:type II secretory pathway component PulC
MNLGFCSRRWLVLVGLVVAGTCSSVRAQETVQMAKTPPFWVAGVVITPTQRSAVLVVLDGSRREVGVATLREGESIEGYRLAGVEPERVLLEQAGTQYSVPVGRPQPNGAPPVNARARPGPIFIPGPNKPTPDAPYTGVQVNPESEASQQALQRVIESPQFQQTIEEMRPILQQRLDRVRQDNQAAPDPSSATPKPH